MTQLNYVHGSTMEGEGACSMHFCENDGEVVYSLRGPRSFHRIQRHGEWWRLAGREVKSGQLIYLRDEA